MKRRPNSKKSIQVREVIKQDRCQALREARSGAFMGRKRLWVGWQRATNTHFRRLDFTLRAIGSHGRTGSQREP